MRIFLLFFFVFLLFGCDADIQRSEFKDDGVVCYVAKCFFCPSRFAGISCVKTAGGFER